MNILEQYRALLPPMRDTLLRGGMTEVEANAMSAGILVGLAWAANPIWPVTVTDLVADILAASGTFRPRRSSAVTS